MSTADFEPISKIYRFKSAFNGFFETIKYKKVGNASGEKVVIFEKNGIEIPLDVLSTGEKQIVFRGTYLLKNSNNLINYVIRISRRVGGEAHKLKGFLRFKELKNSVLYGVINPTNNVIGILAYHFQKRLSNEYWIIKDENRGIYALYDKRKVIYYKS